MSYRFEKSSNDKWKIVEKPSGHVVLNNLGRNKSRDISRALNLGSGFKGNTPAFFCYEYKTEEGSL